MEIEKLTNGFIKKYVVSLISVLVLIIVFIIKPAVNNIVTKVYLAISIVSLLILADSLFKAFQHQEIKRLQFVYDSTDLLSIFVIACCVFQLIFVFGFFKANVEGPSMEDTLYNEDILIVRSTNNVENYDVIVIEYDESSSKYKSSSLEDKELIVKRLIGKGGDIFVFTNGLFHLNNESFSLEYNMDEYLGTAVYKDKEGNYVINEGYYFAMGDNRLNSADSRYFGFFKEKQIVGRVSYRVNSLFDWEKIK